MTRIVIEDVWHTEASDLTAMVGDAIRRISVEMCDADRRTFEMQSFETVTDDPSFLASGEARVKASLCRRPETECRVQFTAMDTQPEVDEPTPAEITVRVIEERIGSE